MDLLNQRDELVQTGLMTSMVLTRTGRDAVLNKS
jgi:hypothetical protein